MPRETSIRITYLVVLFSFLAFIYFETSVFTRSPPLGSFERGQTDKNMPGTWTVLVTGGAGFVGSHTLIPLINASYNVIVVDNLVNAYKSPKAEKPEAINRVERITGKRVTFYEVDIRDEDGLSRIFRSHHIDCVIHFAALKAVGESCEKPMEYYKNNVGGSCTLLEVMKAHNVTKLVYSSSATVYGIPKSLPLKEDHPTGLSVTSPYGKTKYFVEEIMKDICKSDDSWSIISLRYFNPVGAHSSGLLGEDPKGLPNNLMPFIAKVAAGKLEKLRIFGNDYKTQDGTGLRDYIHVEDLAEGHLKALAKLEASSHLGFKAYNLGSGVGFTVLEVITTFQEVARREIKYEIVERRPGDIDASYADPTLAKRELRWSANKSLIDMCADTWNWQSQNPNGLETA